MKPRSSHSIKSKIEFSALSHVACWDGDRKGREGEREGGRSLNLLTFTACCGIKPCGQDRTLTRLSRDDKLAVLPDAWLPDLYSLSGGGGEKGGVGGGGRVTAVNGACVDEGSAREMHIPTYPSIRIPTEQDRNTIQSIFSKLYLLIYFILVTIVIILILIILYFLPIGMQPNLHADTHIPTHTHGECKCHIIPPSDGDDWHKGSPSVSLSIVS